MALDDTLLLLEHLEELDNTGETSIELDEVIQLLDNYNKNILEYNKSYNTKLELLDEKLDFEYMYKLINTINQNLKEMGYIN